MALSRFYLDAIIASDGNLVGSFNATVFFRASSPEMIEILLFAIPNDLLKNLIKCALAFPLTGGAVIRIFTLSSCRPQNSFLDDFGWRWQCNINVLPCHL